MTKESIIIFLGLVVIHFIADFVFQDEDWAVNKWYSFKKLLKHTITYSSIFLIGMMYLLMILEYMNFIHIDNMLRLKLGLFILITFIIHTLTDFITSKINHKLFEEKKFGSPIPNLGAFTSIGFDQVLHYFQLVICYYLIF